MNKPLGVAGKAVIRKDGRFLLVQRSLRSHFDPGRWELPGGKIDHGEDLVEAVAREVREEVGLEIEVGRPFKTWHFFKDPFWVTGVTFLCDHVGGEVRLSSEHEAFVWTDIQGYASYPLSTTVEDQIKAYIALISAAAE
jgi:8-oxo-dGTP diphosphatase